MTSQPLKRILVADNNARSRAMVGFILSSEGYDVHFAKTGCETVSLHRNNPFDLVILELFMTGKDGFQTLADLRQPSSPAKFIVLAKSGLVPVDNSLRMAEKLGAHGVLARPFQPQDLLALVRKVMDN